MRIEPMDKPNTAQAPQSVKVDPILNESSRDRAIKALLANTSVQPPQQHVQNQNQIAPEEMSVVKEPSQSLQEQNTNSESIKDSTSLESTEAKVEPADEREAKITAHYAQLAKREKALRAREMQLKAKEVTPSAPKAPEAPSLDTSKYVDREKLKSDPFGVLNELGLGYEQLTNLALNQPTPDQLSQQNEFRSLKAEIKALREEQENSKKSYADSQIQQREQAVKQITSDVKNLIAADPAFETIKDTNSFNQVVKLIEKTFDEEGIVLNIEDAAREIEEELVNRFTKYAQLNKIQTRLKPKQEDTAKAAAATKPTEQSKPQQQQSIKTLTNALSNSRQLSARERALAVFKGEKI